MKQSLREIIRAAVGRIVPRQAPRRKRKPVDQSLPHPMYRSDHAPAVIRAWGGGLRLTTEMLARQPWRTEGGKYIRSERKPQKRGKRAD